MNAAVEFSTNLFLTNESVINYDNEIEISFIIRDWLVKEFDRAKYTFHLYPNGNFSIEIYPEVIFVGIGWNDYEINAEVEHWYISLEKEKYPNEEAIAHSNEINSREFFLNICRQINEFLKNETDVTEICWMSAANILDELKLFAEVCPDEN